MQFLSIFEGHTQQSWSNRKTFTQNRTLSASESKYIKSSEYKPYPTYMKERHKKKMINAASPYKNKV